MGKISKNLFYNIIYQIIIVIVPLITSPYIARVLGASQIGIYSYTYSISIYFCMFVVLGIGNYGNRSIAKSINIEERSKKFFSIYLIQFFMGIFVIILYITYLYLFEKNFFQIGLIQTLLILSYVFDITWFFYGIENFKIIVFRNIFIKLLSLILILLLVKSEKDLWIYTLIMSGGTFLGQLLSWPLLKSNIILLKIKISDLREHIKPIIILFLPVLSINIFSYMDKTMLGFLGSMEETGFYENADKIISIPKSLIAAAGSVMLPRTANMISNGEYKKSQEYVETTMIFIFLVGSALLFGLLGVGEKFSVVFWGEEFHKSGFIIMILSPAFFMSAIGNVIRTQYLIPRNKDKEYTISLLIAAVINLIINFLAIPRLGAYGAAIGTVCSELEIVVVQCYLSKNEINMFKYIKNGFIYLIFGLVMFVPVYLFGINTDHNLVNLLIQISIGALVYLILIILYLILSKKSYILEFKNKINRRFKHEKES